MHRNFLAESSSTRTLFGMEDRQDMINRNSFCLSQLRRASEHSNSLRRENDALRSMNVELGKKLRVLIQSTIHQNRLDSRDSERFALPKSISVKTDEYVKTENRHRSRTKRTDNAFHIIKEKVYVKRGKSEERSEVEIDVKRQGSTKTELCEKWQQSGECPYGKRCRFAHGVWELRPVVRHPRYKSQICRMVLAGISCPYGHRCHFLHSAE